MARCLSRSIQEFGRGRSKMSRVSISAYTSFNLVRNSSSWPRQRAIVPRRSIHVSTVNLIRSHNSFRASRFPCCASRTKLIPIISAMRVSVLSRGAIRKDVHFLMEFFPYGFNLTGLFIKRSLCDPSRLPKPLKPSFQCAGQSIPIDPAIFAAGKFTRINR